MKMINIFFLLVLCLVTSASHRVVDGRHSTIMKEDLELDRQLNLINKPPIKSIHTKFGYIVDCIDINKQPAFDHPLLKNHKLQRRPTRLHIKTEKSSVKISSTKFRFGFEVICPTETVPIRRTTKDELIRAKSFFSTKVALSTHAAEVALIKRSTEQYYGISGTTSIYNPRCDIAQESSSHIFVQNGEGDGTNKIIAGWHVFPHINGDDKTYAYATWTSDNFKSTGCYNVKCPGFVQINSHFHVGMVVTNTSLYGGPMIEMPISIFQDPKTKNWWLTMNNEEIGYFPATLFSNLKLADQAGWGGGTIAIDVPSPPMGSGLLPDENFYHAGYFRKIGYKNESGSPDYGPDKYSVQRINDASTCYGVEYYGQQRDPFGYSLQFGGSGGNCGA